MKPLLRDGMPYCSLLRDEIRNYEGRRICHLTQQAITTRVVEAGAMCRPYVAGMRNRIRWIDERISNPGVTLLRTFAAEVREADASR